MYLSPLVIEFISSSDDPEGMTEQESQEIMDDESLNDLILTSTKPPVSDASIISRSNSELPLSVPISYVLDIMKPSFE